MSLIGSLEDLALGDILQIVSLSRRSGILYLTKKGEEGKLVFSDGQIISASISSNPNNILGLLKNKGILTEQLEKKMYDRIRFEEIEDPRSFLINSNVIDKEGIDEFIKSYVTSIIFNFFEWKEGNFNFELSEASDRNVLINAYECYLSVPINPQYVAMEAVRQIDEQKRAESTPIAVTEEMDPKLMEMEEIIILDPNTESQSFFKESLESRGLKITVMDDLRTLYNYLESIHDSPRFPLIVTELAIPKTKGEGMLGGLELLNWTIEKKLKIPIILLSSVNNEEVLKEAKMLGVYAYLKKPKKFSRSLNEIDTYMDIVEKVSTLMRQYHEAGFTFKPVWKEVVTTKQEIKEEDDAGHKLIQDITEELTNEFVNETDLLPEGPLLKTESSPGLLTLKSMIDELMHPNFTGEVTLLTMRFASELLNRGVLFLVKKNNVKGLGQFGLESFFKNPNMVIKKMEIKIDDDLILGRVMQYKRPIKAEPQHTEANKRFIDQLGGVWPIECYVIPLLTVNRVAAIFYGDNVPFKKPIGDMTAFEIFMNQASVVMEKSYLERMLKERK